MASSWQLDQAYWRRRLQEPDWYQQLIPYIKYTCQQLDEQPREKFVRAVRQMVATELTAGQVALAHKGPDLDKARQPVDTIVIHHTSWRPGYRLDFMEAVQLLNIYAPYYMNPTLRAERGLKGMPIWSNHFADGRQTFLCYHWLMRMNGQFERLLPDRALGWHAGNWEVNRRSVAICLDNDYEAKDPRPAVLAQLAAHIKQNYPQIKPARIIGHCQCRQGTICPGKNWLDGWKPLLLEKLAQLA